MSKNAKKSKSRGTKAIKVAAKPKANPSVEVVTGQSVPKGKARGSDAKPKRVSALDAAAQVLQKSGQAMRSQEMIAAMAEQGLWSSPNGKTPHATLYAAILREINEKGGDARFRKSERGKFEYAA